MKIYAIYGASGFGREVMPIARYMLSKIKGEGQKTDLVFVDDKPLAKIINGHRVLSFNEYISSDASEKYIAIAVSDSTARNKLTKHCKMEQIKLWNIRAQSVTILDEVKLGEGSILCGQVTLTSNIKIGMAFHANIYSYVGHDCVIGDYVTFAPAVKCNGNVLIQDNAYIGTGAVLKQGSPDKPLLIGESAVVGMGSVVTKDVPPGAVVAGNPAKLLLKKTDSS